MKNGKKIFTHYLSLSYKALISHRIVHYILFLLEIYILLMQILEIYYYDFISYKSNDFKAFSFITIFLLTINKLPNPIKLTIYILIIIIVIINYCILNTIRLKINFFLKVMINITELLFYRLISLFILNYFFIFIETNLYINIIFFVLYILVLMLNFYKNHLFIFFPNLINYPYDIFSMIIDLHLLIVKIFLSISAMISNKYISKFCFIISIFIIFVLFFYLSYLMKNKSYYLMNNCNLNIIKYSTLFATCIMIIIMLIIGKKDIFNLYYDICFGNILIICILFIFCLYDPYQFSKIDKDDNKENAYYYFFILDNDKNKNFLLEEKIEEHISKCNKCNLCKKYNNYKNLNKNEFDLYHVIFNGKDLSLNLINNILRGIKKNGKSSFINNSYYLINLTYIYCMAIKDKNYNYMLNTELLYEIINSENSQFLEEYKISLNQIKYTNKFLIKAKKIIHMFYEIFDEKNIQNKSRKFLALSEELDGLKYKEIKSNLNINIGNSNEGIPNCNNLITLCSLFYEELLNESFSNSGIFIRETPNIIEDLINNNTKNSKQITLEINVQDFQILIIRAGGYFNKYENNNFIDFFPSIFKNRQILEMKNILLNSNNNLGNELTKNKSKNNISKKIKENKKQNINFNFIIEEKEDNEIFYRYLKLKINLIFLPNINIKIYLNGIYTLDKDIIVTEKQEEKEKVLYYGNKIQMNLIKNKNNNNIIVKKSNNNKYLGNNKLIKEYINFLDDERYAFYHIQISNSKNNLVDKNNGNQIESEIKDIDEEEKIDLIEEKKDLILFNDITSQGSSKANSVSKSYNFLNYNRGNKKIKKKDDNFSNKLRITRYILIFLIMILLFFIVLQSVYLYKFYKDMNKINDFNLLTKDYSANYEILFFSILSIT